MTTYQLILLLTLILWPLAIFAILYVMSRLEERLKRQDVATPKEAGLEPVAGTAPEKEVAVFVGDKAVSRPEAR